VTHPGYPSASPNICSSQFNWIIAVCKST
jgi:hypothetical protein